MKLYLHIGTEKTGSSFIQTTFARNRDWLSSQGIFYPKGGKRESDMMAGLISPGNAKDLTILLLDENWKKVEKYFRGLTAQVPSNITSIVLSNENMLEALANPLNCERLVKVCQKYGFKTIEILLILRDPLDQALSLYKHRAKSGSIPNIEVWLLDQYPLPDYLDRCIENLKNLNAVNFKLRKYTSDSKQLVGIFFKEWLNIGPPQHYLNQSVNPSLTLSELHLLRKIKQLRPSLAQDYYKTMLAIDKELKSDDVYLKSFVLDIISNSIAKFNETWIKCNSLLRATEQLSIPKFKENDLQLTCEFSFSDEQMNQILLFWQRSNTIQFRLHLLAKSILERLKKLKQLLSR